MIIRWILPMKTSIEVTSLPYYSYWQKGNNILHKHLQIAKQNAKYTSKTIQNEIVHIYASKIKQRLTVELREKGLPFTIMADEVTDPYANQEILSVCIRFVDLSSPLDPHIKECLIAFMNLDSANASTISTKIYLHLSTPSKHQRPSCCDVIWNCRCSSEDQGDRSTSNVHPLLFSLPQSIYCSSLQSLGGKKPDWCNQ